MTRFCLDTSAYSWFRRGHPPVVDLVTRAVQIGVPVIVLGELRAGFGAGRKAVENETVLSQFLREPVVTVWDVSRDVSRHFADIVLALKALGSPLPTNDIWIAAVAAEHGVPVLTYDAHFERIARVASIRLESPDGVLR